MKILRKVLLMVFVNCCVINVYAKDIAQGTVELEGDSSFSMSSEKDSISGAPDSLKTDSRDLSLQMFYYVAPNLGVGVAWFNNYAKFDDGISVDKINQNLIAPAVGYNLSLDPASSIQLYAAIIVISDFKSSTDGVTNAEGDFSGNVLGARYKYFLTESVSINAGLSVSNFKQNFDGGGSIKIDTTDLDVGLSVYF